MTITVNTSVQLYNRIKDVLNLPSLSVGAKKDSDLPGKSNRLSQPCCLPLAALQGSDAQGAARLAHLCLITPWFCEISVIERKALSN